MKTHKPIGQKIDSYAFDFAIKAVAIQFNLRENHGDYEAASYENLFIKQSDSIENYILFLNNNGIFSRKWNKEDIRIDYYKALTINLKTSERLNFDTLEVMI